MRAVKLFYSSINPARIFQLHRHCEYYAASATADDAVADDSCFLNLMLTFFVDIGIRGKFNDNSFENDP